MTKSPGRLRASSWSEVCARAANGSAIRRPSTSVITRIGARYPISSPRFATEISGAKDGVNRPAPLRDEPLRDEPLPDRTAPLLEPLPDRTAPRLDGCFNRALG